MRQLSNENLPHNHSEELARQMHPETISRTTALVDILILSASSIHKSKQNK
jgi:hypothetical protein